MKVNIIKYNTTDDLIIAKKQFSSRPHNTLIQVFCGTPEEDFISGIINDIETIFPETPMIGTTTAGEICNGESLDNATVVSIVEFEEAKIKSGIVHTNGDLSDSGRRLAEKLCDSDSKVMIVFGCGINNGEVLDGEPLLHGIHSVNSGLMVAGAQAGDNGLAKKTFVFSDKGLTCAGVAAATISGSTVFAKNHFNLSWIPIGKKFTITHAEGNCIHTLDNEAAKDVYSHYLGPSVAEALPASAAEFPFIVNRFGLKMARHANKVNPGGSLNYMSSFYTGEQVQFAYCHSGLLALGASEALEQFSDRTFDVVFVYSCVSRKWVLGEDISIELSPLSQIAPSAGFFSYGEYYHNQNQNFFLSQTMTMLGLSETETKAVRTSANAVLDDAYNTRQLSTLRVLHRLVEVSNNEILEINDKLNDSIRYGSLIQRSLIKDENKIQEFLPNFFVLWMPKDQVGGDIYLAEKLDNAIFLSVIDCTGHGVPGAFLTMIASTVMRRIIKEEKLTNPALILKQLNYAVKKNLKLDTGDSLSNEGMDAAACLILPDEGKLIYAGARIPLICIFNNDIIIKKADKRSIGYKESRRSDINYNFKNHEIIIEKGMSFYLATDGFADQFGGKNSKKLGTKQFHEILRNISTEPFDKRKEMLIDVFDKHKGIHETGPSN